MITTTRAPLPKAPPSGKQLCLKCQKICSINRTQLCFLCRTTLCAIPGCTVRYVAQKSEQRYCDKHRRIEDREAYRRRNEGGAVDLRRHSISGHATTLMLVGLVAGYFFAVLIVRVP